MTAHPSALQSRPSILSSAIALALGSLVLTQVAVAQTAVAPTLDPVEIVGTTPLPGTGIDRDLVPANVQSLSGARLREQQELNLAELLRRHVASVNVVETQGNPYQLELNYRGFTASPLLGQPQGLSVFLDGVRVNEAFGDVVNWDLIPRAALSGMTLMPGSNPLFGLNTLGGALVLQTRSGDTDPGSEVELGLGSFGRKELELSHGMSLGASTHLFVALSRFEQDGWRDHSPSEISQLYAKLNGRQGAFDWRLSVTAADNSLVGNGLLPEALADARRSQIYTRPDRTDNQLGAFSLGLGWDLGAGQRLQGQAYLRKLDVKTVNGDLNDAYDPVLVPETGVENRTAGKQTSRGVALQWSHQAPGSLTSMGLSYDSNKTNFRQTEAEGMLDDTRAVIDLEDEKLNAAITGKSRTTSVWAEQITQFTPDLSLSLSARHNRTRVSTFDVGRRLGLPTTLDARDTYSKLNPGLGATVKLGGGTTAYAGYSQGNRAPSPIELGCSDPDNPCVLPNALQADPPLKQVVSRTLEAGLRGKLAAAGGSWRWNAGVFSTQNKDDILFVSNSLAAGYFQNFGKTRRQGAELGVQGRAGAVELGLNYTRLDATYQSGACVVSEPNSTAYDPAAPNTNQLCTNEAEIEVRPGDRLPGIPQHLLKFDLAWRAAEGVRVGANVTAQSGAYVRGNENNRHQPDGVDFFGSGRTAGFAVLNLDARWAIAKGLSLVGKINNVLDRRYDTGGMLGENAFDPGGNLQHPDDWRDEQFVAPAAPRSMSLALRWRFGS
jgi:outer membrane receptor protein involved in Fe transport